MSMFDKLCQRGLIINYPGHMKNNVHYETIMGSYAYEVSGDLSDTDIYGFCIPYKSLLFPYAHGNIFGFGKKPEVFNQFQQHHIFDPSNKREYDLNIFNIVQYFQLCMECNPNMIDSLYTKNTCVLTSSQIANRVRENRDIFLSKLAWHKFKGYAFSQLTQMKNRATKEFVDQCIKFGWDVNISLEDIINDTRVESTQHQYFRELIGKIEQNGKGKRSKRLESIKKYGFDVKFGYHVVRLLDECDQILTMGRIDLTRDKERMKAVRAGEYTMEQICELFDQQMVYLEQVHNESKLRYSPDEDAIKTLLLECLEMHFGNLNSVVSLEKSVIQQITDAYSSLERAMRYLK